MNDHLPLYAKVRAILLDRLTAQVWAPGQALPAETALAVELGVSQGTVRKSIDSLCAEGVLTRSQGRGTFVAEHTDEIANFKFFRLAAANGDRVVPELQRQIAAPEQAKAEVAKALSFDTGAKVHVLDRVRVVGKVKSILETVTVPDLLMPGFSAEGPLPNALYPFYQSRYGINVVRTEEQLSAVPAQSKQSRLLGIAIGTPLLLAERIAFDMTGRAVEHRRSHFLTQGNVYSVELS